MNAAELAKMLKNRGVRNIGFSEPSDDVDGEIKITEKLSVQVGFSYFHVVLESPDGQSFKFFDQPCDSNFERLLVDIKTAEGYVFNDRD